VMQGRAVRRNDSAIIPWARLGVPACRVISVCRIIRMCVVAVVDVLNGALGDILAERDGLHVGDLLDLLI
jgi:hypothetical protein